MTVERSHLLLMEYSMSAITSLCVGRAAKPVPLCAHAYALTIEGARKAIKYIEPCGRALDEQFVIFAKNNWLTYREAFQSSYKNKFNSNYPQGGDGTHGIFHQKKMGSFNGHWGKMEYIIFLLTFCHMLCVALMGLRGKPIIPLGFRWERIWATRSYACGTIFTSHFKILFIYLIMYLIMHLIIHLIILFIYILWCNYFNININNILNIQRIQRPNPFIIYFYCIIYFTFCFLFIFALIFTHIYLFIFTTYFHFIFIFTIYFGILFFISQ